MSLQLPFYQDGYPLPDRETTVVPSVAYPFLRNPVPDKYSKEYTRLYDVLPRLFVPNLASRTAWANLLTYSEAIDNAAWTKSELTVVADATTAPDGQVTMDKVLETVTNAEHSAAQAATVTAAATEASVFAQGGLGRSFIRMAFVDSAATTFSAFFDIVGGNVGGVSAGVSASIVAIGDSQFQCVMSFTPAAGAGTFKVNMASNGSTISYAGDVTKGAYVWGAQVATGSGAPYTSTTSTTRTVSAPVREIAINANARNPDPMAYLVTESDPNNIVSSVAVVQRKFSRVPLQQIRYSSYAITKPTIANQASSSVSVVNFALSPGTVSAEVATAVRNNTGFWDTLNNVYSPFASGVTSIATTPVANGGTFTLTYKTSTTGALAYNASGGTISTALNGLAAVIADGVTYVAATALTNSTGGYLQLSITVGATSTAVTMDTTSLTLSAAAAHTTLGYFNGANTQYIQLGIPITATGHGYTANEKLLVVTNFPISTGVFEGIVMPVGTWAVYDANTLVIACFINSGGATALQCAKYLRTYTPGAVTLSSKLTENYYLPGVTSGITTAANIPVGVPALSDAAIISAVLGNGALTTVAFQGPDQYVGPIYRTTKTEIDFTLL